VCPFAKLAAEKNLNKNVWGFIGAASYYIPVLLMGFVIFPALISQGIINISTEGQYMGVSIVVNLLTGVLCCMIAYQVLKYQKDGLPENDGSILDQNI